MRRMIGSATLGLMVGAASGIALIALLGAISGIPYIVRHSGGRNDPITMFLAGAVMFGFHMGIPIGAPVGAILGLLIGAVVGFKRARGDGEGAKPLPDRLS